MSLMLGKRVAHLADNVDIPARLDLHLDALVAVGQFVLDLVEEMRNGVLHADGDAAGNFAPRAPADVSARAAGLLSAPPGPRQRLPVRRAPCGDRGCAR